MGDTASALKDDTMNADVEIQKLRDTQQSTNDLQQEVHTCT